MMPAKHSYGPDLTGLPECARELHDSVAIVARGISLDAWNNNRDFKTALEAHHLAWRHASDPNLRDRLAEDEKAFDNLQHQTHTSQSSGNAGCLVIIIIFVIIVIIGAWNSSTNTSSSSTPYTPAAQTAPAYTPPAPSSVNDSGDTVHRVPSSVSSTLDQEKAEIETDRTALQALDAQIEKLGREIESDRLTLDTSSQSAVDDFNAKVDRYNALVQKDKTATAAFNERVDNYNAKLRQYGR